MSEHFRHCLAPRDTSLKKDIDSYHHILASSSACTKTKGVAIMARYLLEIKIPGTWGDTAGRLAVVRAEVCGSSI